MAETHWDSCWSVHHDCAIERIRRLEAHLAESHRLVAAANEAMAASTGHLAEMTDRTDLDKAALAAVSYELVLPAVRALIAIWPDDRELDHRADLERWAGFIEETYRP